MGHQRRGPATHGPAAGSSDAAHESAHAFDRGNDAARAALAHGGDPDGDDDDAQAERARLVHARLVLQIQPTPPADLERWLEILRGSLLPTDRREALLAALNRAQLRALEVANRVAAEAGGDGPDVRAGLSDAIGAAVARLDEGRASDPALASLCGALAAVRLDEGDEEALLADQVAEEQA